MKKYPVILDVETKYSYRDVADTKKLGISVIGIYDYKDHEYKIFLESEVPQIFPILENTSYIIGFNVESFDLQVIQGYYPGKVTRFPVFDILEDVRLKVGKRLSLNDILKATLGKFKTGHGLNALNLYKDKKLDELKQYCQDDVRLTKELFDFGVEKKIISYLNQFGKVDVAVDWGRYLQDRGHSDAHLTLPF